MKRKLFIKAKEEERPRRADAQAGLYDAANEHDACGVGMIVNIHGN